ncbi:unnamed protein product [Gongylonema pulchrum]|uniref:Esterase n=1 Tax=Gongylonema pulchrum TaxID=637853 RepID=A0A183EFB0_9BILA|nr:unnamed protein product [Gongylonema pulchrum]
MPALWFGYSELWRFRIYALIDAEFWPSSGVDSKMTPFIQVSVFWDLDITAAFGSIWEGKWRDFLCPKPTTVPLLYLVPGLGPTSRVNLQQILDLHLGL